MINLHTIVIVSGGFDPLHAGHVALFNKARQLGDSLVVLLNSDEWLTRKKGKPFMDWTSRAEVIKNIKSVTDVIPFDDRDNTACNGLKKIRKIYQSNHIIFANGGDRNSYNTPENNTAKELGIQLLWNIDDPRFMHYSSSEFLRNFIVIKETRGWGSFKVLDQGDDYKVKELYIKPYAGISLQKHMHRSEHWVIVEGTAKVDLDGKTKLVYENESVYVPIGAVHKITNVGKSNLKIIEVQVGKYLEEDDIVRFSD